MKKEKKTIIEAIECYMQADREYNQLFETAKAALSPFEGKTISKRLATAVQKAMPEHTIYYEHQFGMYHLIIWKESYDSRQSLLLGYDSNPVFHIGEPEKNHSGFEYYNICCGKAALDRMKSCSALLADTDNINKMAKLFKKYIEAKAELSEYSSFDTPALYSILKAFDIDYKALN